MERHQKNYSKKLRVSLGFTLLEMLMAITIIALLVSMAVQSYKSAKDKELNKGLDLKGGIDVTLQSCHTGFIDGYFIEGHVPHDAITKLLTEKPSIKGITVPGMPAGVNVPGMEVTNERAKFDVLAVNTDGSTFIWKQYE